MKDVQMLKQKAKCCSCEGSLRESLHFNIVVLDHKVAAWRHPVAKNLLGPGSRANPVAVLCDLCIAAKRQARHAIESDGEGNFLYHTVDALKDIRPVSTDALNIDGEGLTRFLDSPDAGDPNCNCSACGGPIEADETVWRAWPAGKEWEIRLHGRCLESRLEGGVT